MMSPRIEIGSKFFVREESTRTEHILVLGESSSQNSEMVDASSSLGKAFLGRGINEKVAAKIQIEGRWEILSIVRIRS
jgi:hypothetical protein